MQTKGSLKQKRTLNACIACRRSKIKCTGEEPCANCRRRLVHCHFTEAPTKNVRVEKKSLRLLHQRKPAAPLTSTGDHVSPQAAALIPPPGESDAGSSDSQRFDTPPRQVNRAYHIWTSPFTLPSRTIINTQNNRRRWIWLAPASIWSFTVRLTLLMTEKLNLTNSPIFYPKSLEDETYVLQWRKGSAVGEPPDVTDLPSLEDARYLFNTTKFHIGQIYPILDESTFLATMEHFHRHGARAEKADELGLWYVQYLLVLSLGKAYLSQSKNRRDPPSSKFFRRAMALMPDSGSVWKDSIMAIVLLSLAGLYLFCMDNREAGHVYLCQAIRIAQFEGFHTRLPEDELGVETVTRCRNLWWTLYIMDRHFSSSLGVPTTTQDCDITTLLELPNKSTQQDIILVLQVRLWRLLSTIATTVYKTETTQLGPFLESTKIVLHELAGHAQDIEKLIHINPQNSAKRLSKATRHIVLLYHKCVIYATRPLLLSVLIELLELNHEITVWQELLALTKPLVHTGIKSAIKTIQILSDEDSSLDAFLPFDLEFLHAAAMHLLMAGAIFQDTAEHQTFHHADVHAVLDEMIAKGSRVAEARKAELCSLELVFQDFTLRAKQQELQTLSWPESIETLEIDADSDLTVREDDSTQNAIAADQEQQKQAEYRLIVPSLSSTIRNGNAASTPRLGPLSPDLLGSVGISADDFFSIVDHMDNQDFDQFGLFSS